MENIKEKVYCSQCGGECISKYEFSTGYGTNSKGQKICYKCCGDNDYRDLENLKVGERISFYLVKGDSGKWQVANWPGTMAIPCYVREGNHNIAGVQRSVEFSIGKKNFYGRQYGDNSQICHIKRGKDTQ